MKRVSGFTLIELLVVIAIIAILAAIAVPRVGQYISDAQVARAVSDIRGVETSVTSILSDIQRRDLRSLFTDQYFIDRNNESFQVAVDRYTNDMYALLRRGREASEIAGATDPNLRLKLSNGYVDLQQDPWGQKYLFFIGPIRRDQPMPFRGYRLVPGNEETSEGLRNPLVYDQAAKQQLDNELPGNPPADNFYGIPGDKNLPIYIWSRGEDGLSSQGAIPSGTFDEKAGGGDDINNWDKGSGWEVWY